MDFEKRKLLMLFLGVAWSTFFALLVGEAWFTALMLVAVVFLIRNHWIHSERTRLIRLGEGGDPIMGLAHLAWLDRQPSYEGMFFRFWVWNVNGLVDWESHPNKWGPI